MVRLSIALTAARVLELKSRADAIGQLQSIVADTTRRGLTPLAFEARLALAQMEYRAGDRAIALAHLTSLEKDAVAKGFGLIARKARAAREVRSGARASGLPPSAYLQDIVGATGLSKSAVQGAIRTLTRRRLLRASRDGVTAVPAYMVLRPWRK